MHDLSWTISLLWPFVKAVGEDALSLADMTQESDWE